MNVDHLSPSSVGMMGRCGMQVHYRYGEGLRLPPGFGLIRGGSVHRVIEHNFKQKMTTRQDLEAEEIQDRAADEVKSALAGNVVLDGDYAELGFDLASALVTQEVVGLSKVYHDQVAPTIQPRAVEVKIELAPSGSLPVKFLGIIDVIDDEGLLRDAKTSQKSPFAGSADESDQLTAYELLHRGRYGVPPSGLVLDFAWRTPKKGQLKTQSQMSPPRPALELSTYVARARRMLEAMTAEVFVPAPEGSWVCTAKYCGYHQDAGGPCPFSRGRRRPTS